MKEACTKLCNACIAAKCRGLGQSRGCDVTVKLDLK